MSYQLRNIGLAAVDRGQAIRIPQSGVGGGGEFGASITDSLRTFAITREPAAHRMVFTVAHDIFDKWFELQLLGKEVSTESEDFDSQIQKELTRLHAKRELTKMGVYERGYGWAIIAINFEGTADHSEPLPQGEIPQIEELCTYGPPQITSVKEDKDPTSKRYGLPETYFIHRGGTSPRLKIHHSRAILFNTRLLEHEWKGVSVLDAVWDDIVTLRNERWSMGQTLFRHGPGFPDLLFKNAELAKIQEWVTNGNFGDLSAWNFFAHNENQEIEFKGASGVALDPMNYYLPVLESISLGSGIPLAILRGAQAGALTGSEVNQLEYYGLISDEQTAYEEGIRKLINLIILSTAGKKAGAQAKGDADNKQLQEYDFNWISGIQLTERGKAEIDHMKAQTLQIKGGWHTLNELRKMEDPNATPLTKEQGGDKVLGQLPAGAEQYNVKTNPDGSQTVTDMHKSRRSRQTS